MDDYGPDPALVNQAPAGLGPSGFDLGQWRDIESAPLDRPILGWSDEGVAYVCWAKGRGHAWAFYSDPDLGTFSFHPTHWMPLPPPPSTERI